MFDTPFDEWLYEATIGADLDEGWWEADHGIQCPNCLEYFTEKHQSDWHCYWCDSTFHEDWSSGRYGDYGKYRKLPKKETK